MQVSRNKKHIAHKLHQFHIENFRQFFRGASQAELLHTSYLSTHTKDHASRRNYRKIKTLAIYCRPIYFK